MVVLVASPLVGALSVAGSPVGAKDPFQVFFDWTETEDLEALETVALGQVRESGGSRVPPPTLVEGYATLPEDAQRVAWRAWLFRVALDQSKMSSTGPLGPFATPTDAAGSSEEETPAAAVELGNPRGLSPLWSLEAHGWPQEVRPADKQGGTFLVTSHAILRFASPSASPSWLVKPGGWISHVEVADVDVDGDLDVVVGIDSFLYGTDEPTVAVIEGTTGALLFSGFMGDDALLGWTLTDLDGNGRPDLLGIDAKLRLVGAKLDGTSLYRKELAGYPDAYVPAPYVGIILFYLPLLGGSFGDVTADGVADVVVTSAFWGYARAVFYGVYFDVGLVTAYQGKDGSVLWQVPSVPHADWTYPYPLAVADLDGDKRGDPVIEYFAFAFVYAFPVPVYVFVLEESVALHRGTDGALLAYDRGHTVYSFPLGYVPVNPLSYFAFDVLDLDGSGAAELVTIEAMDEPGFEVVGRTYGNTPGGPTKEIYRQAVELPAAYDDWDGYILPRDVDADNFPDLLIPIFGVEMDEDGAVTNLETRVFTVDARTVSGFKTDKLIGAYDFDPVGRQAYAWIVESDRWGPVDAKGILAGPGTRLVVSVTPLMDADITGDGVNDLLLRKSEGVMWLDGKSGALLQDISRPPTRYVYDVYEEDGRLRLLEYDFGTNAYYFTDLRTLEALWTLTEEQREDAWLRTLTDANEDGRLDVALQFYDWDADIEEARILDMQTRKVFWTLDTEDVTPTFRDVLPSRVGDEVIGLTYGEDDDVLSLYAPPAVEPLWSYNAGNNGRFEDAEAGYVLVRSNPGGRGVLHVLLAQTGAVNATLQLADDTRVVDAVLEPIDVDTVPDVLAIYAREVDPEEPDQYFARAWDWSRDLAIGEFRLADGISIEFFPGYYYTLYAPELGPSLGDWDGDGYADFSFAEQVTPTVRSTKTGSFLAVGAEEGEPSLASDLNGDGRPEFGTVSLTLRLRFFAYDPAQSLEREGKIRLVSAPDKPQTEAGAEEFFDLEGEGSTPSVGAPILFALLAFVAFAFARRRRIV